MFFLHDIPDRPYRSRTATFTALSPLGYVNDFWAALGRSESYSATELATDFGVEEVDLLRKSISRSLGIEPEEYPVRLISPF